MSTRLNEAGGVHSPRSDLRMDIQENDQVSLDDIFALQEAAKATASADQVISGMSRSLRDKLVRLEVQLIKTLDSEARVEQVAESIAVGGPTEVENPSPADARKLGSGVLANKPFDYSTEQSFKRIFELLRQYPQLLSQALIKWNGKLSKEGSMSQWLVPNLSEKMARVSFLRSVVRDIIGQNTPPSLDRSLSLVSTASSANPAGSSPSTFSSSTMDTVMTNFVAMYLIDYASREIGKERLQEKTLITRWHSGKFFDVDSTPSILIESLLRTTCRAYLDILLSPILEWIYANESVDLNIDLQQIIRRGMRQVPDGAAHQQAKPHRPTQLENLVRVLFASTAQSEPFIPHSVRVIGRIISDLSPVEEKEEVEESAKERQYATEGGNAEEYPEKPSESVDENELEVVEKKQGDCENTEEVDIKQDSMASPVLAQGSPAASPSPHPLSMLRVSSSGSSLGSSSNQSVSLADTPLGLLAKSSSQPQVSSDTPQSTSKINETEALPFAEGFTSRRRTVSSSPSPSLAPDQQQLVSKQTTEGEQKGSASDSFSRTSLAADPVTDLFFIHLISAALNTPELYGIVDSSPVTPIVRANLQLLASIVMKTAMMTYYPCAYPDIYADVVSSDVPPTRPSGYKHGLNDLIQIYGPRFRSIAKSLGETIAMDELTPSLYSFQSDSDNIESALNVSQLREIDERLAKVALFSKKALSSAVHESNQTLILLCIQPNDLASLHRVLLSAFTDSDLRPQEGTLSQQKMLLPLTVVPREVTNELSELLKKISNPLQYTASTSNLLIHQQGMRSSASSSGEFSTIPFIPPGGGSHLALDLDLPVLKLVTRTRQQLADDETAFWLQAINKLGIPKRGGDAVNEESGGAQVSDGATHNEVSQWRQLAELLLYILSILPPLSGMTFTRQNSSYFSGLSKVGQSHENVHKLYELATQGLSVTPSGLKGLLTSVPWLALIFAATSVSWRQSPVGTQFTVLVETLGTLGSSLFSDANPNIVASRLNILFSLVRRVLVERNRGSNSLVTSLALAEEQIAMVNDDLRLRERRSSNFMQQLQSRRLLAHILNRLYALHKFFDHNSPVTQKQADQAKTQHQRLCQYIYAASTNNEKLLQPQGVSPSSTTQIIAAARFLLRPPLSAFSPLPSFELLSHVAPLCGGVFPADLSTEKFICSECVRRTERLGNVVRQFMAKYVADPNVLMLLQSSKPGGQNDSSLSIAPSSPSPPATPSSAATTLLYGTGVGGLVRGITGGLLPPLKLDESGPVSTMATDYVIAHVSNKLLLDCPSAEYRSTVDMAVLRTIFPNFASFYLYMNQKPTLIADFAVLKPFIQALEEDTLKSPLKETASASSESAESPEKDHSSQKPMSVSKRIEFVRAQMVMNAISHPAAHRVPFLGQNTLIQCVRDIRKFLSAKSPHAKLRALSSVRSVISTTLNTPTVACQPPLSKGAADCYTFSKDPMHLLALTGSSSATSVGHSIGFPFRTLPREEYAQASKAANSLGIPLHPQVFASLAGSAFVCQHERRIAESSYESEFDSREADIEEECHNSQNDCLEDDDHRDLDTISNAPSSVVPADAIWYANRLVRDRTMKIMSYEQALTVLKAQAYSENVFLSQDQSQKNSSIDSTSTVSQESSEMQTSTFSSVFKEEELLSVRENLASAWRPGYQGSAEDYLLVLCYALICAQPKRLSTTITFLRLMFAATTSMKSYIDLTVAVKCLQTTADRLREAARRVHAVIRQEGVAQARQRLADAACVMGFRPNFVEKGLSFMSLSQLSAPHQQALETLVEILTSPAFGSSTLAEENINQRAETASQSASPRSQSSLP